MSDFRSILEMMPDEHCMVEPFIESQGDLRLGKNRREAASKPNLVGGLEDFWNLSVYWEFHHPN